MAQPVVSPESVIRHGSIQKPKELEGLINLVSSRPPANVVLEIGSYKGGSLWMWCRLAASDALIVSVDLPGGEFGGGYNDPEAQIIRSYAEPNQRLELIRGDSHHMGIKNAVLRTVEDRAVDILFIDGDHTLAGVTKDWEMYSPLVRYGGLVVFHDIVDHASTFPSCQVKPLWDELKEKFEHYEFVDPEGESWAGIGVLVK